MTKTEGPVEVQTLGAKITGLLADLRHKRQHYGEPDPKSRRYTENLRKPVREAQEALDAALDELSELYGQLRKGDES
jgi:hypothetical protein